MQSQKPKIIVVFREDGYNGGPYISHKRIVESPLCEKYDFVPIYIKNARDLRKAANFINLIKEIKAKKI